MTEVLGIKTIYFNANGGSPVPPSQELWKNEKIKQPSNPSREGAFSSCGNLVSVNIPAATTIGNNAFSGCNNLVDVNFPAVTSIGDYTFADCYSLTNVSFPAATSIGEWVFGDCDSLTSVSFPAVTSIGEWVFGDCDSLTSVSFPAATTIGDYAFAACASLATAYFPSVINIGNSAFAYTENTPLTITLGSAAPALELSIFDGVTGKTVTVQIPNGATGYSPAASPFTGTQATVSGTIVNWGNGFRGGGWNGSAFTGAATLVNTEVTMDIVVRP
ncbi:MAG: leucine-rich repeat domain-containing protein [Treponema sp.]|nr:leucine-rich repeat domain-containing protein [Treponema sp.]